MPPPDWVLKQIEKLKARGYCQLRIQLSRGEITKLIVEPKFIVPAPRVRERPEVVLKK